MAPNMNITVSDEDYQEIRKSENKSKAVRDAFAELRELRKHKCPEAKTIPPKTIRARYGKGKTEVVEMDYNPKTGEYEP